MEHAAAPRPRIAGNRVRARERIGGVALSDLSGDGGR